MQLATERTEKLLALLLLQGMKGQTQLEKVLILSQAGFSRIEVADLLDTTAQVVSQRLHESKRLKSSKKRKKN